MTEIKCPQCGRKKAVKPVGGYYHCDHCKITFDAEDDGDIGSGPPDQRLLREEGMRR